MLSTEGWLVLIIYAPQFKEFEGAYCVCIVRYFVRVFHRGLIFFFFFCKDIKFDINISIFIYYLLPHTKQYNSSISEILFSFLLNHTMYQLGTC